MALAALCGDDEWGQTWARVLQHRFAGDGEMHGHAVGNLLIVGALGAARRPRRRPRLGRPAARRQRPGAADGADAAGHHRPRSAASDPSAPRRGRPRVRGQVEVATTDGRMLVGRPRPRRPAGLPRGASPPSRAADWVVLGPGSWFTSVIPHLLVPALRQALVDDRRPGRWSCSTWPPQAGETDGLRARPTTSRSSPSTPPTCRSHTVLADPARGARTRRGRSRTSVGGCGAGWWSPTSPRRRRQPPRHDPGQAGRGVRRADRPDDSRCRG